MDDASDDGNEIAGQAYDVTQRSLLSADISTNAVDIATNATAIVALQSAAPNSHYHDIPGHTHSIGNHYHSVTTGIPTTSSDGAASMYTNVTQSSGPAGSTAVGHTHVAAS